MRGVLGSVQTPTLVVGHQGARMAAQRRYLADHIPGARLVELEGSASILACIDPGPILDATEEFLTDHRGAPEPDRVLATVLFTDLVSSTPQVAEMGDRRWRNLIATHDALVRAELDRFRGREVRFDGDGVLATFDGPGRAIRCACAIRDALGALGLEVRAGLHTGEIEQNGNDIAGIAVHIGKRVSSIAGPGEVLVSRTVADLVAGSDIELHDKGEHELKGVIGNLAALLRHLSVAAHICRSALDATGTGNLARSGGRGRARWSGRAGSHRNGRTPAQPLGVAGGWWASACSVSRCWFA